MEEEEQRRDALFSANAAEAAHALNDVDLLSSPSSGVNPDGSRWWKETGVERRPDGVICKWTLMRGVSADQAVEWQTKFWEAADVFGYKELGSEKSGRDAVGNVWREFWRESMREVSKRTYFKLKLMNFLLSCLVDLWCLSILESIFLAVSESWHFDI